MDGVTYTTIFTATQLIHEGWNYMRWDDAATQPKYRFYRFYSNGGNANSCKISEIKFQGIETMDDTNPSMNCATTLYLNGVKTDLATTVQYTGT
jgi:hypothetical protein